MHDNDRKGTLDEIMSSAARRRNDSFPIPVICTESAAENGKFEAQKTVPAAKKPRRSRARTRLIKTRLSDSEYKTFCVRVKRTDISASEFLRRAALTEQIVIHTSTEWDMALLDELERLKADVGRVGGLLKMTIRPNEGQRMLRPQEWAELLQIARQTERTAKQIAELEVKIANGYRQA